MKKYILFLGGLIISNVCLADTLQLIQPEKNKQSLCRERNAEDCIRAICIRAADLDCNNECMKAAREKCTAVEGQ